MNEYLYLYIGSLIGLIFAIIIYVSNVKKLKKIEENIINYIKKEKEDSNE